MPLWDFIQLLGQQGIPVAEYNDEEIQQEVESAEWLRQ
jgi:predicted HTH domain antitoxin